MYFQPWLEDDRIKLYHIIEYIILFNLSSSELPTTFKKGGFCFYYTIKDVNRHEKFKTQQK